MTAYLKSKSAMVWIGLCLALLYLLPLGTYPLMEPDEGRYSEIPRAMLAAGDYITPRLNGVEYFEKPALQYWMTAGAFAVFGENELAARLFPALAALLGAALTGWVGRSMFGARTGLLAAVITATSFLYKAIGSINILDMPLSLFLTAAMAFFYQGQKSGRRRWFVLFYLAMALGVLTKGLVAIVLPLGVVFWYIVLTRRWRLIADMLCPPGILLFFAVTVPWFWLVCRENPDFFYFFFIQEHFLRFTTKLHDRYEPFYFFFPYILLGIFPWTGFLPSLLAKDGVLRRTTSPENRRDVLFLVLWFGVILLFYSMSDSKLIPYIVPCLPPLALLLAASFQRCEETRRWLGWGMQCAGALCIVFAAALIIYSFRAKYGDSAQLLLIGSGMIAALTAGAFLPWLLWKKTRRIGSAIAVFALAAFFFCAALQPLFVLVAENRTAQAVAVKVEELRRPGDRLVCYGDYLQGMPFYLKERVMLVDYLGELEFGSRHPSGQGWFLSSEEFAAVWNGEQRVIAVMKKNSHRAAELAASARAMNRQAAVALHVGKYTIVTNR